MNWKLALLIVALLILAPIGDALNRYFRSGGYYTTQLPDWLYKWLHRKKH